MTSAKWYGKESGQHDINSLLVENMGDSRLTIWIQQLYYLLSHGQLSQTVSDVLMKTPGESKVSDSFNGKKCV